MVQSRRGWVASLIVVGVVASASIARAGSAREAGVRLDRDAVRLVQDVEEIGHDVRYHAERLRDLAGQAGVSPWAHYHHLDSVKDLVNDSLRPALRRLADLQKAQPHWKQESIERMIAAATQLAADASSAYMSKARNPKLPPVMNEGYRRFVAEVAEHAATLTRTGDAAHTYAVARMKAADAGLPVAAN